MDNYRVVLAKRAKDDIMGIGDYITFTLLEPDISKKFIKGLRNPISQLKFFPFKFPLVQNSILPNQNIRCMSYNNYYVFYEVVEIMRVVIVLRIGSNRRNWKDLLV